MFGIFVTKRIISPIVRLIDNAKKIASGEDIDTKEIESGKNENEVDELVNAFI